MPSTGMAEWVAGGFARFGEKKGHRVRGVLPTKFTHLDGFNSLAQNHPVGFSCQ